jgi:Domain of unknown function (DUF5060)
LQNSRVMRTGSRVFCFVSTLAFLLPNPAPFPCRNQAVRLSAAARHRATSPPSSRTSNQTVRQWSVHELRLTAENSYANPYTDVTRAAVFTPPPACQSSTKLIRGFWEGGDQFRVRFTPTCPGVWKYSISSSPADPGLARKSGSIAVLPPNPGEHGLSGAILRIRITSFTTVARTTS